jgi:transposase
MSEDLRRLARRLVVGRKSDGRGVYDEAAKAELVAACRKPGASVSRLARACGINTNQLYRWMRERAIVTSSAAAREAFVPMLVTADAATAMSAGDERSAAARMNLHARLPNGVMLDVHGIELHHAVDVIEALGRLRCSASTTR